MKSKLWFLGLITRGKDFEVKKPEQKLSLIFLSTATRKITKLDLTSWICSKHTITDSNSVLCTETRYSCQLEVRRR